MNPMYQPRTVSQGLSIQQVGEETLIYDERRHLAFCLNRISSAVWKRCNGAQTVAQIAAALETELALPVSEDIVLFALAQFEKDSLLESGANLPAEVSPAILGEISRRNLMTKLGYGAAMLLPVVAMIAAPTSAQAQMGSGGADLDWPESPAAKARKDGNS